MKKDIQELYKRTYKGKRTLPDGTFVSQKRLLTIQRVAEIAQEIKPGPESEEAIKDMVAEWREEYKVGTIKLYLEVCKQATKGKDYIWPSVRNEIKEPTPIPIDIAKRIINDDLPQSFVHEYDMDCFTACKVAINSCLRPIDAINITLDNVGDGEMIVRHRKTKKQVRSKLHPSAVEWLHNRERKIKNVFTKRWYRINENYRKRMVKSFLLRLLDYYEVSDKIIIGVDAGNVTRKKLRDVITAKSLRSTGANLLLSMGVPAHNVMAIGGWSSYEIFSKHYLKPDIDVWKSQQS